ncbi:helix-turn-helix transcriptional regulator [bacterium]|nr:helix-turn-helix transcriptional regulator [bacterium]
MSKAGISTATKAAKAARQAQPSELQLHSVSQARALLQPLRIELLRLLAQPHGIRELAQALGATPQKVHYHLKALEAAGLVRIVSQRRVRALTESIYQAVAESFAPGPELLAMLGGRRASRDQLSKGYLLALAEDLVADAAQLALSFEGEEQEHPTLSITAQLALADPQRRQAFLAELQAVLQVLAEKYSDPGAAEGAEAGGAPAAGLYKLVMACYPQPQDRRPGPLGQGAEDKERKG